MSAEYPHKLTRDSMASCRGCCSGHGHLCEYHEGFNEGIEALLEWIVACSMAELESET